jgi:multidrug efflux system outer membrane protein
MTLKQAESLVKSTQQKLPTFVMSEKNMRNSLALLVGVLPSEIKNIKSPALEKEVNFDNNSLYEISAKVVQTRPDVYSSEQKLIAQNALIGNKMSQLLPSLSLKSFLGFQNNTLSPIFAKDYNMYSSNIQSLLPLFHWGAIINGIKAQQSATKEALYVYKSSLLQAVIDISNSIVSVEENSKNFKLAKENYLLYNKIAELSKHKYDSGLISFSDFLDDKQNEISAQIAKYQALTDFYTGIISFYKAIGGGLNTNYSDPDGQKDSTTSECEPCKD